MGSQSYLRSWPLRNKGVHPDASGFTLIETMLAMIIIAVGLLATASLLIGSIKHNSGSEHRMDSAAVSQALLAEYVTKEQAGTTWTSPASGTREGYDYTVTRTSLGSTSSLLTVRLSGGGMTADYENQTVVSTASGG
jgi:prepilin-type N-terminal cleavage/methylation domain-containing protein